MSETNETIADIAAEIRDIPGDMFDGTISMFEAEFHSYADRIEAAWEREKAEVEASALAAGGMVEASRHKQGGNSAAMRAAVERCVDLILRFGNVELIETPIDVIIDIEMILKSALRAAPRNLDLYECEEDAWLAFSNAHGGINASTDEYEKWLFERSEQTEKGE